MSASYKRRGVSKVTMSDATILVSVEDLIYTAFAPGRRTNRVNFKLLRSILHLLARQMRLLEQDVEIKLDEINTAELLQAEESSYDDELGTYSSSSAEEEEERKKKGGKKDQEGKGRSKDRDDKDRGRGKRGEDYEDEGGRERGRGKERSGERGADGRRGIGGEREDGDEGGRKRGRGRERRGERGADGRGGIGGEREDGDEGGRKSGRGKEQRGKRGADGRGRVGGEREDQVRGRPARIGSIEVVTASQFMLLEKAVKQLKRIAGPLPEPVLPDNETLRQNLATGRASLQDTMQAVQLNARVQAAEEGLYRMAGLLTQLAQAGLMPVEMAGQVGAMEQYLQAAMVAGQASADPGGPGRRRGGKSAGKKSPGSRMDEMKSTASRMDERGSTERRDDNKTTAVDAESQAMDGFKRRDMDELLDQMKHALYKEINNMTARANHSADKASTTSRNIEDKMNIAMEVDGRVTELLQQTEDYAKQVDGFDSGIKSQVNNFQEQLVIMRNDLAEGLALVDASHNNAETTALVELTERHQELVLVLENSVQLHKSLSIKQHQIGDEIQTLIALVEVLREQKADRDEMLDGLKDKADLARLSGLLHQTDFAHARTDIEESISKFYEVFNKQNVRWQVVLADLMNQVKGKAEILQLMLLKDSTNTELNGIQQLLQKLEIMLGKPKAAILMRKLAKDASCGVCLTPALTEPKHPTHGKPPPLPALRPPPLGAEQKPCFGEVKKLPPDIRVHTCHRWVGGSHTLMSNVAKVTAEYTTVPIKPTKKFEGYGLDGKLYMMEEDMQPCAECNKLDLVSPHPPTPTGAGAMD